MRGKQAITGGRLRRRACSGDLLSIDWERTPGTKQHEPWQDSVRRNRAVPVQDWRRAAATARYARRESHHPAVTEVRQKVELPLRILAIAA